MKGCEYEVWNRETGRMAICNAEVEVTLRGKAGHPTVGLCKEHAAFVADAGGTVGERKQERLRRNEREVKRALAVFRKPLTFARNRPKRKLSRAQDRAITELNWRTGKNGIPYRAAAWATATDAGEASMRKAGREKWAREDYAAAIRRYQELVSEAEEKAIAGAE